MSVRHSDVWPREFQASFKLPLQPSAMQDGMFAPRYVFFSAFFTVYSSIKMALTSGVQIMLADVGAIKVRGCLALYNGGL